VLIDIVNRRSWAGAETAHSTGSVRNPGGKFIEDEVLRNKVQPAKTYCTLHDDFHFGSGVEISVETHEQ
jgi:hypothetical protein